MNFDRIQAAAIRLNGRARVTPLLSSPFLDKIAGRQVWVKAECLQHTGSFKFRGGWAAVSALNDEEKSRGILAYSSGNHAQGVAYAAQKHGVAATILMPSDAPEIKIQNTRALGAEVILYDRSTQDRDALGEALRREKNLSLIKPFDDPEVIAGQGSVGLEIAQQAQVEDILEADVLVCCGGGGLTSGVALALEKTAPRFTVRPVEPEGFDDVTRSLETGVHQTNKSASGSICDAILTPSPGQITFPILKRLCGSGIVVTELEVLQAMALAFQRLRIVIEPGGAVSLAAALFHGNELSGAHVICIATGGNTDPATFKAALQTLD
ncbi:threonine/serine dehydratase [Falsihalocynthiibacter sp. BN13B15]|uniref:threonine ammonia-lyase n=1 Tax=Falsihalocynthiibacter sp. BN13B15 TaxID=3240871 RepID=UPI00350EB9FA